MEQGSDNVPNWLDSAPKEQAELFCQVNTFLEGEDFEEAKEHIDKLFELLGGEEECKNNRFHELFYLRGEIKLGLNVPCHDDFLIAYHLCNTKNSDIKRVIQEHLDQRPQVNSSEKSSDITDAWKSSIQKQLEDQNENMRQQNQILQQQSLMFHQMFQHQTQLIQQLQSSMAQLQNKLESSSSQTSNHQTLQKSPSSGSASQQVNNTSSNSETPKSESSSSSSFLKLNSSSSSQQQPSQEPAPQPQQEERKPRPSVGSAEEASAKPRADSTPVQSTATPNDPPRQRTATVATTTTTSSIKPSFTMEGWLHKLGGWNKTKWESRYFACDGIELSYHASQQIIQTTAPKGNIYLKDIIAVEEVHFDVHKVTHCFAIQTPTKKYFFYADDEISKMKWINALRRKS